PPRRPRRRRRRPRRPPGRGRWAARPGHRRDPGGPRAGRCRGGGPRPPGRRSAPARGPAGGPAPLRGRGSRPGRRRADGRRAWGPPGKDGAAVDAPHCSTSSLLEVKLAAAEGQGDGGERAVEGDRRELAGRGGPVRGEGAAVTAVHGRPVAPAAAGRVGGTGTAVRHRLPAPGDALPPALEAQVEEFPGPSDPVGPGLVRGDGDLTLDQLLAGRGE